MSPRDIPRVKSYVMVLSGVENNSSCLKLDVHTYTIRGWALLVRGCWIFFVHVEGYSIFVSSWYLLVSKGFEWLTQHPFMKPSTNVFRRLVM